VYCTRNVAVEMFCWDMCGEDRDLVVSGKGVYGGGGPRVAAAAVVVVVVVGVTAELRGRTTGGEEGVKRKGGLGKAAAVAEEARRRVWAQCPDEEDARLRTAGEVFLRGWEVLVEVVGSGPLAGLG
jgi:hypothetical protein